MDRWWADRDSVERVAGSLDGTPEGVGAALMVLHSVGSQALGSAAQDPFSTRRSLRKALDEVGDDVIVGAVCKVFDDISGMPGYGAARVAGLKREADHGAEALVAALMGQGVPWHAAASRAAAAYGLPAKSTSVIAKRMVPDCYTPVAEREVLVWAHRNSAAEAESIAKEESIIRGGHLIEVNRGDDGRFAEKEAKRKARTDSYVQRERRGRSTPPAALKQDRALQEEPQELVVPVPPGKEEADEAERRRRVKRKRSRRRSYAVAVESARAQYEAEEAAYGRTAAEDAESRATAAVTEGMDRQRDQREQGAVEQAPQAAQAAKTKGKRKGIAEQKPEQKKTVPVRATVDVLDPNGKAIRGLVIIDQTDNPSNRLRTAKWQDIVDDYAGVDAGYGRKPVIIANAFRKMLVHHNGDISRAVVDLEKALQGDRSRDKIQYLSTEENIELSRIVSDLQVQTDGDVDTPVKMAYNSAGFTDPDGEQDITLALQMAPVTGSSADRQKINDVLQVVEDSWQRVLDTNRGRIKYLPSPQRILDPITNLGILGARSLLRGMGVYGRVHSQFGDGEPLHSTLRVPPYATWTVSAEYGGKRKEQIVRSTDGEGAADQKVLDLIKWAYQQQMIDAQHGLETEDDSFHVTVSPATVWDEMFSGEDFDHYLYSHLNEGKIKIQDE
jgi:hypothetical protein